MAKIDIISGFLGAGKTTLIRKLIAEAFDNEKLVLIENEFGEIGIDGGFLKEAGVQITEMNSGCICCSLVGDFGTALKQVITDYAPDRVIIEPSGVGKLSDVIRAVENVNGDVELELNSATAVVDVSKAKMYMKNFGEFFNNQIESAGTIVLSRTQNVTEEKLLTAVNLIKEHNAAASIITTPWDDIDGKTILSAMDHSVKIEDMMKDEHEHHHHYDEDGVCSCGHHHDEDEDEHEHHHHHDDEEHEHHHHHDDEEHEHHHHHDDEEHEHHRHHDDEEHEHHHHHDDEHEHHHHYDEDGVCSCGHHHDEDEDEHEHHHHDGECGCGHHHHHHADEVFTSWGKETAVKYTDEEMKEILETLSAEGNAFGVILRAKGIVPNKENEWIYFDLVPGEYEIRKGKPDYTGKLCVIGSELKEDKLAELFRL
jgi:G3E family GTPase